MGTFLMFQCFFVVFHCNYHKCVFEKERVKSKGLRGMTADADVDQTCHSTNPNSPQLQSVFFFFFFLSVFKKAQCLAECPGIQLSLTGYFHFLKEALMSIIIYSFFKQIVSLPSMRTTLLCFVFLLCVCQSRIYSIVSYFCNSDKSTVYGYRY